MTITRHAPDGATTQITNEEFCQLRGVASIGLHIIWLATEWVDPDTGDRYELDNHGGLYVVDRPADQGGPFTTRHDTPGALWSHTWYATRSQADAACDELDVDRLYGDCPECLEADCVCYLIADQQAQHDAEDQQDADYEAMVKYRD